MKILFLYAEVNGYTEALFLSFAKLDSSIEVHCVHWDKNTKTNFIINSKSIFYYERSKYASISNLKVLVESLKPALIYVSGWMDKDYLKIVKYQKSIKTPIITGLDNHWIGSARQYLASLLSFYFIKPYFDFALVAGFKQYEFARRLGFSANKILNPFYSADTELFNKQYLEIKEKKRNITCKRILFVGRFVEIKGIKLLVEAFKRLSPQFPDWELKIIGNGILDQWIIKESKDFKIIVSDFLQPNELVKEIVNASFFCLPSSFEPWGVVVHEFAAAGLPLVVSDNCGSGTQFVINNYNGFIFKTNDLVDLGNKLKRIMEKSNQELFEMGKRSYELSKSITPEKVAATILSILN